MDKKIYAIEQSVLQFLPMTSQFHQNHIRNFLHSFDETPLIPLDLQLRHYLKQNKAIGSKDRKVIGDTIYELIRFKGLIDRSISGQPTWDERLEKYLKTPLEELAKHPELAPHEKVSFPKEFYDLLLSHIGKEATDEFCRNSNLQAPLTVRVNLLKISRDELFKRLSKNFPVSLCLESNAGILFHKKINFFELPEFKEGLFEVQDEASQLVADYVEAEPGDEVLDYCAGSGGKSLSIATKMKGKGQIFLHDVRKKALEMAKQRFKRAGIQNIQILSNLPSSLKKRIDHLLLDVPCTGSGTWRRNPDQKWKFTTSILGNLVLEQRKIFEEAIPYLAPKGKIVYATCSVLPEENEMQVAYFCEKYNLRVGKPFFKSLPKPNEKDGFFAALLEKTTSL